MKINFNNSIKIQFFENIRQYFLKKKVSGK